MIYKKAAEFFDYVKTNKGTDTLDNILVARADLIFEAATLIEHDAVLSFLVSSNADKCITLVKTSIPQPENWLVAAFYCGVKWLKEEKEGGSFEVRLLIFILILEHFLKLHIEAENSK